MIIEENEIKDNKIKDLEQKNNLELESLERLIILFEDIKNIENSNLDYAKEILKDVEFKEFLIIGNLGKLCKAYFESYYETKIKQIQNLKKIINIMKFKSYVKTEKDKINPVVINNTNSFSLNSLEQINNPKYIGKKDVLEILDSMSLINEFNNDYINNYDKYIGKEINNLKNLQSLNELDMLKGLKEEKQIFENKVEDICNNGTESKELDEVKNILLNDNSNEQKKINWIVNYLNKYRSQLSIVEEKVYNAFKILFEIIFNKLSEKKLFQTLDLAIILIQTFSKKKDNVNILLEEEFKNNIIFKNSDLWINLIIQKTKDLLEKITEENKYNNDYIKENIEPILVSYIYAMKDFNIDNVTRKKVIEDFCNMEDYSKYKFNIEEIMSYSPD